MNILNRNHRRLVLVLTLGLLAGQAPAKAPSTKDLIADLKKSLPAPAATPNDLRPVGFFRYADQLETLLASGRYAEVEQTLTQLRTMLPAGSEKAADLIEQLLANVRAQMADAAAKQEAAYAVIEKDFVAKFEAKAPAADFDALLKRLAALPPVVSANNPNSQKLEQLRNFITRWQDYLLQSARGNTEQALQSLNDLVQQSSRLPIIPRSQLANLQAEAAGRVSGRNEAVEARLAALQKQLATVIDSAQSPADFDAILVELAKPLQIDGIPARTGNSANQVENLRRFAARWQDYFALMEAGNVQNAQNTLRELSTNNAYDSIYPRSRILARLNGKNPASLPPPTPAPDAKPVEPLLSPRELTADTVGKLLQQLALPRSANSALPAGHEDLVGELVQLRDTLAGLKAGNYQPIFSSLRASTSGNSRGRVGDYADAIAAIKAGLVLRAMALHVGAPPEVQPAPQDNPASYAKKLIAHSRQKHDWNQVYRVLLVQQSISGPTPDLAPDLMAFQYFLAGQQHEKAGLWSQAIRSYIFALSVGAPNLPADEVGQRLQRLSVEHPEEYAGEKSTFVSVDPLRPGNYTESRSGSTPPPQLAVPVLPAPAAPAK